MTPQQRHDLANVAQAVFWAIEQGKRDDALAELEIFFDEIHAAHTKASNDVCGRLAQSHAELDDIRKALGIESGQPILPAIEAVRKENDDLATLANNACNERDAAQARLAESESVATSLRAYLAESQARVAELEAKCRCASQNADSNLEALTRCRALVGSAESKLWSDVYVAVAGCFNAQKTEVAERWADAAIASYRKRFSP